METTTDSSAEIAALADGLSRIAAVDAVLLSGSRAGDEFNDASDYDLYVYSRREIPVSQRLPVVSPFCDVVEMDNRYWETEDDGILKDSGIPVDIVYRNLDDMEKHLHGLLNEGQAAIGYTTCLWHNFISSRILFDRHGEARSLIGRFDVPYPRRLKENVIALNYPLLRDALPSYLGQVKKAVSGGDAFSVHHRVTAFLESYFDILFAVNELPHTGEKKIRRILEKRARRLPSMMGQDLETLLSLTSEGDERITKHLGLMVDRLDAILSDR